MVRSRACVHRNAFNTNRRRKVKESSRKVLRTVYPFRPIFARRIPCFRHIVRADLSDIPKSLLPRAACLRATPRRPDHDKTRVFRAGLHDGR